ncbi:hypothetical protein [Fimbriiglobus ruber]|uniref:Uncharacterized protein n=1 Tax=Fimbriiglobus ruber TaxID=1908690 RepID=A0A225DJZ4_9BACT|nr:hypothetical protein [Fimbriiglobus ruber]OWK41781.1 hypothetical protein FRUB_03859 [Fimbriiglobus ruber]
MSERPAPPGAVGLVPRPADPPGPAAAPWECLFPTLPPDVQHYLLRRAATTGGLTTIELPSQPSAGPSFVARYLAADPTALPPPAPVALADPDRPPEEYAVLSHSLGCPDLFLVDADEVDAIAFATDLAGEAAAAGERVLVLTPGPAEADAILGRLARSPGLLVGRAVAPDEPPLPPALASHTARAQGTDVLADARRKVTAALADAGAKLAALRSAATALVPLRAALDRCGRLGADRDQLLHERGALPAAVDSEAGNSYSDAAGFAAEIRARAQTHAADLARTDAAAAVVAAELAARRDELAKLKQEKDELARQCEGKRPGGLSSFMKGLFGRDSAPDRIADLDAKTQAAASALAAAEASAATLAAARTAAEQAFLTERGTRIRGEIGRRTTALDEQLTTLDTALLAIRDEVRAGREVLLGVGVDCPTDPTADHLDAAATSLAGLTDRAAAEVELTRGWAATLTADEAAFVGQLLEQVRVVIGPVAALGGDPFVTIPPGGPTRPPFDRVVWVGAEAEAPADFDLVARYAPRWVLIGSEVDGFPDAAARGRHGPMGYRGNRPRPNKPTGSSRVTTFRKLWQHMHRTLWTTEGGRLVARLTAADLDRTAATSEPLADDPGIELRFVPGPDRVPVVAQVVFPPRTSVAAAKTFLARELGEIRVVPCGPVDWHDAGDHVAAVWQAAESLTRGGGEWADLAPGVREKVTGSSPDSWTAVVTFDKAAGWNMARAAEWVERHAAAPRTTALARPAALPEPPPVRLVAAGVAG